MNLSVKSNGTSIGSLIYSRRKPPTDKIRRKAVLFRARPILLFCRRIETHANSIIPSPSNREREAPVARRDRVETIFFQTLRVLNTKVRGPRSFLLADIILTVRSMLTPQNRRRFYRSFNCYNSRTVLVESLYTV